MKNALVSSTKQWNPGDEFIWFGVRKLFEAATSHSWNYHLWNRNPDQFVDGWSRPFMSPQRWTNSVRSPGLDLMDCVIFAGSPEWLGPTVEPIYRDLLVSPIPLLCIGVGSGSRDYKLTSLEQEILRRPQTFITCRSLELAEDINSQLGFNKAHPLPCPAFFCGELQPTVGNRKGLILQDSTVQNHSIPERTVTELTSRPELFDDFIHFYYAEFFRFQRKFKKSVYSFETADYLTRFFPTLSRVVSTRLHGALACLSLGIPTCIVDFGNFRVNSTCNLYREVLPILEPLPALDWIQQARSPGFESRLRDFRESVFTNYQSLLRPFLKESGL